ncbi:hypothetical protein [uncultured Draconibacterium sp.]|uniref:hypothetical protein n=1 Tax=uncultured Draconibacterium sp. TaxID=1573823 RepID=UPI0025DDECE6|nr:hypothetical protein [uncultured Draconibacterium sp.]
MVQLKKHIIHFTLAIVLAVLAVANAAAQITIEECDTMEFSVVSRPEIPETHFVWGIYNSSPTPTDVLDPTTTLDPALYFVDGQYAGSTVKVTGLAPGVYYVRIHVWDEVTCTDNIEMYVLEVLEKQLDFELVADSVCIGEPTTVRIIFSGVGPYTIHYTIGDAVTPSTYNLNGDVIGPEISIPITDPLPVGETTFWVLKIDDGVCKSYEYAIDERPSTGILIYPKPDQSRIYLKDN